MPTVSRTPPQPSRDQAPAGSPTASAAPELATLIDTHQHAVWRYLRLLGADADEADDLMQEAFLAVDAALRRGDVLRDAGAFLRGAARNLLLAARRKARRDPIAGQWADAVDAFVTTAPEALEDARLERLRRCLAQLGGRAREAVQLHHCDGASLDETARRMELGLEGARSLLARARRALRDCIERTDERQA
ncbi:MAG: sigma-70 family RNA polymerase sigma factor [Planctomycetota bacterium]